MESWIRSSRLDTSEPEARFLEEIPQRSPSSLALRARAEISSQNSRPDLGRIGSIRKRKTAGVAGTTLRILRLRIGPRWPEDGMRKWEVISARALSPTQKYLKFERQRLGAGRERRGSLVREARPGWGIEYLGPPHDHVFVGKHDRRGDDQHGHDSPSSPLQRFGTKNPRCVQKARYHHSGDLPKRYHCRLCIDESLWSS